VPELLSVVHEVLEPPGSPRYVLTGSSARKLRRGGANLLAGRALLRTLHPFMAAELAEFRIEDALRFGLLPLVVGAEDPEDALRSYAALYLEQEVQLEGWAWNIGNFARFMESISMSHGAVLNVSNVARECQIERKTAAGYVEVIEDLLLGFRLPEDKQQILMQRLEEGRADTYNKLRALVDSLLIAQGEQTAIGPEMSADHKAVGERYDRMIERLAGFIRFSFNPDDLKILPRVVTSSLDVNIQRLDLIAAELHKIKKALIQAQAARDAAGKEAA
jgi:hypothetical protein